MTDNSIIEILLVEDNSDDAELTMRALKDRKITNKIQWVKDGSEALDFVFGRGSYEGRNTNIVPRVILLDLKLPKVDGLEVLRQIKSDPEHKVIPVVVMTSSMEERDMMESYKLGVNSYIVKPINFDSFARVVFELGAYWLLLNKPLH